MRTPAAVSTLTVRIGKFRPGLAMFDSPDDEDEAAFVVTHASASGCAQVVRSMGA